MPPPPRPNVSDTARWVAAFRARESDRADALFRDPLARRLAGDLGLRMADGILARWVDTAWPVVARTCIVDELVSRSITEGADRVLNLAAGLDTRPYRMAVPPSLSWVEADLPAMVDEKSRLLEADTPRCTLTREKVDLSDGSARGAFLERALAGSKRALVITEGLLPYLEPGAVRALAADLARRPEVAWWLQDLASPIAVRLLQLAAGGHLGESARLRFGAANGVAFFAPMGWTASEIRSVYGEARKIGRLPRYLKPLSFLAEADPENPRHRLWYAVVRYTRR